MSKLPKARPMTAGEVEALRENGLDPAYNDISGIDKKTMAEMSEWIVANVYQLTKVDIRDVPYNEVLELGVKTFRLTYGFPEDIKN